MTDRLLRFDLMRSLAIFIILLHHLPEYCFNFYDLRYFSINLNLSILNELNRHFGLSLFVFLSGHLINLKEFHFSTWRSMRLFLVKRTTRIFPLYYLALIFFCYITHTVNPLTIILHVLGLQLIAASPHHQPLPTIWFVGMILTYYFLFAISKTEILTKLVRLLIITLFPLAVLAAGTIYQLTDLRLVLYYGIFWFGVHSAKGSFLERFNLFSASALLLLFLAYLRLIDNGEFATNSFVNASTFATVNGLMLCFVIFVYHLCKVIEKQIKSSRIAHLIAYSSYGMFLFHRPIWFSIKQIVHLRNVYLSAAVLIFVGIPLIVAFAKFAQSFYDQWRLKYTIA